MRKIVLALVAVILVAIASFLFRSEATDLPELGRVTIRFGWGKPALLMADMNRDGRVDFRGRVRAPFNYSSHDFVPLENLEDRDYDGHFELHVLFEEGEIVRVEIDKDGDGSYERILYGDEARTYYASL